MNRSRIRNVIITCTYTECFKRDCPNHTPFLKPNSIAFSSCMNHPNFKTEKLNKAHSPPRKSHSHV